MDSVDRHLLQLRETLVALDGAIDGIELTPGDDGREVQFQATATHIQWRYVGDTTWVDLVAQFFPMKPASKR